MNPWTSEEDAWWWCLWTPNMSSASEGAAKSAAGEGGDQSNGEDAKCVDQGTGGKFDQWIAVKEALKLDGEGGESDYDPVTGWGIAEGTVCPVIHSPDAVAEAVLKLAGVVEGGGRVLDLGCGDGRVPIAAALCGAKGVGLDINPSLIRAATRRSQDAGVSSSTRFEVRDFMKMDVNDEILEGVTVVRRRLL
jgi:SAM-dependent methyltransferase